MAVWDNLIPEQERRIYERGGWGGIAGFGQKPALLVVDMYTAFVDPAYPFASDTAPNTVASIKQLLVEARGAGIPVIFSRASRARNAAERGRWKSTGGTLPIMARPEAYEIVPELAPLPSETVLVKTAPSAFFGTDMVNLLVFHNVDTVILTGTVTSGCVRATAVDAFSYNFRVVIPEECVCDRGPTSHAVALFDIHMKYGDVRPLTDVIAYLRGVRTSGAVEAVKA